MRGVRTRKTLNHILNYGIPFLGRFKGITYIHEFNSITIGNLLSIKDCGYTTANELAEWLASYDVQVLGMKK